MCNERGDRGKEVVVEEGSTSRQELWPSFFVLEREAAKQQSASGWVIDGRKGKSVSHT